jgi:hypothetical protein
MFLPRCCVTIALPSVVPVDNHIRRRPVARRRIEHAIGPNQHHERRIGQQRFHQCRLQVRYWVHALTP